MAADKLDTPGHPTITSPYDVCEMINSISHILDNNKTAEAFQTWAKSDAGGRLVVRDDRMTPASPLAMVYYDKEKSDMTVGHVTHFRSVVWDMNRNQPVAIAPQRSAGDFHDDIDPATIDCVEDFVDGVMINMFYDGDGWRVATRTQLDATGHFYGKRPFADLFWETFRSKGIDINTLNKSNTYSWVLQHPEERIVVNPDYGIARLWLIEISCIENNAKVVIESPSTDTYRPVIHDLHTVQEIRDRVAAWGHRFGAQWKGLMVHMKDGSRYKIRSAEYEAAATLRGNQPKLPFLWLERWTEGKLHVYTRAFPEESHSADATVQRYKDLTQEFYDLYQQVYRKRELRLGDAPHKFRKLLWEAREARMGNYFGEARDFMNRQDTARKLWLINYEERYHAPHGPLFTAPVAIPEA
jgi:hypothetical protein